MYIHIFLFFLMQPPASEAQNVCYEENMRKHAIQDDPVATGKMYIYCIHNNFNDDCVNY
jgi:hypothetical protein